MHSVVAPEIPTLLTDRLRLRAWRTPDLEQLTKLYERPETRAFMPSSRVAPASLDDIWESWRRQGYGAWAVEERRSGRFIGTISLLFPGHWPSPEISWLLDVRFWNQGLATEGATAVVKHAFAALHFERLLSVCLPDNVRSERVMQKLGMTRTPVSVNETGEISIKMYELTVEQWIGQQPQKS